MIKDSGERTVHPNGFQRDMHEGKGRMDLLPWRAIIEVSKHCEEGAKKYGERNIDKGCPQHSLIDSAMRHLAKYTIGMTDEDHLRACAWNIMWALEQEVCRPDMQDIPAVTLAHQLREMNGGKDIPVEGDIEKMNEELDSLSAKHPGAGYQSGIRRGIREAREIFAKYFVNIHTPTPGGWEKIGEEDEEIELHLKKYPKGRIHPEEKKILFSGGSINPERRCVEFTCYWNTGGFCQAVTDLWNPELGQECPDFSED